MRFLAPLQDLAKAAAKLKEYYQGLEFIKIELRDLPENDKKLYKKVCPHI
jgi:hypothetical protein